MAAASDDADNNDVVTPDEAEISVWAQQEEEGIQVG